MFKTICKGIFGAILMVNAFMLTAIYCEDGMLWQGIVAGTLGVVGGILILSSIQDADESH